jgi:general secretion pathway protein F
MEFSITAYRRREGVSVLTVAAVNEQEAENSALAQGFALLSIRRVDRWAAWVAREPRFDLQLFSLNLGALLKAGLSLPESLGTLSRNESALARRRFLEALIRHLREGKAFSTVLREFPDVFPPIYLALISTAEQTGDLVSALDRLTAYHSRMDDVRKRVVAAAIYPALLLVVGGFVIVFLMTYVVPRFSHIYEEFGQDLPLMSSLLLQWGGLLDRHGGKILLVGASTLAALTLVLRQQKLNWRSVGLKLLALPTLKPLKERTRRYALSRFYRTLGLLIEGGIPVVTALGMTRELLDDAMRLSLDRVETEVRGGAPLSQAMERHDLAPAVASDLLRIGERTGDMAEKMQHISDFYDAETMRWVEWFSKLFEPLLMLFIGFFIAFVVVLLYLPIFELAGSVR